MNATAIVVALDAAQAPAQTESAPIGGAQAPAQPQPGPAEGSSIPGQTEPHSPEGSQAPPDPNAALTDGSQTPAQPPLDSPDTSQTTETSSQAVGVAAVMTTAHYSVISVGEVIEFSVSLTGAAITDTILYPIVYQSHTNDSYSPIDQSVFLFPLIKVPAGNTTTAFEMTYRGAYFPGTYVISIVTADEASRVADLTQLPVTKFATLHIDREEQEVSDFAEGKVHGW